MGDFFSWYFDLWQAVDGFGTLVLMLAAHFVALLIVMGVLLALLRLLGFAGDLGKSFADGWRKPND